MAMLGATGAALAWANCAWPHAYESFWITTLSVEIVTPVSRTISAGG